MKTLNPANPKNNGALPATKASKFDLLWTNPSPSAAFAAQTIELDLSAYDLCAITVFPDNSYSSTIVGPMQVGLVPSAFMMSAQTAKQTTTISKRQVTISQTDIVFQNGVWWSVSASSLNTSNAECVPYQIYGIKL